jgi:hypothetical protein
LTPDFIRLSRWGKDGWLIVIKTEELLRCGEEIIPPYREGRICQYGAQRLFVMTPLGVPKVTRKQKSPYTIIIQQLNKSALLARLLQYSWRTMVFGDSGGIHHE